jgi:hypothetical protein
MVKKRKALKTGPKPLPKTLRRSRMIGVAVNDSEMAALRKAAGHTPVAVWVRDLALKAAKGNGR